MNPDPEQSEEQNAEPNTLDDAADVSRRLARLGINEEALREAIERGISSSLECTASHSPTASGTYRYHETVRWLRDLFRPFGWTADNSENRGLTLNSSRTMAIIVASGNEKTGIKEAIPSTRNPKGPTTVQAVRDNTIGWLFEELEEDREMRMRATSMETWILLLYRDDRTRTVRSELSLPVNVDGRLRPDLWRERLILPPIPVDEFVSGGTVTAPSAPGTTGEINVEIRRRA